MFFARNYKGPRTWEDHVQEALREVKTGQHLRFINDLYLTKEVCLAALMHETGHNSRPYDIGCVPIVHLDYVVERLKASSRGKDAHMIEYVTKRAEERKKKADASWSRLPEKLDEYKVSTYDELLEKIYLEKVFGEK